ncbi:MAG: hypothetical protein ACN4GF_03305 [Lentimonas sp.]
MKLLYTLIALSLCSATLTVNARPQHPVASKENRMSGAQEHLKGQENQLAVYTRGLVCSSCGIGLRIHIGKLDGIDKTKLDKGMLLDSKNQLVIIAYDPTAPIDIAATKKAIHKAGYEPTHYYKWDGQNVVIEPFPEDE